MAKAKNISKGDWIMVRGAKVRVTRVSQAGPGEPIEIDFKRGTTSGVAIRSPKLAVKRIYAPKLKGWW